MTAQLAGTGPMHVHKRYLVYCREVGNVFGTPALSYNTRERQHVNEDLFAAASRIAEALSVQWPCSQAKGVLQGMLQTYRQADRHGQCKITSQISKGSSTISMLVQGQKVPVEGQECAS